MVNGHEVAAGLTADLKVLVGEELEIYATFNTNNETYTTKKTKVKVGEQDLNVNLELSSDTQKKLNDSQEAKKAKEAEAKNAEQQKAKIATFLSDYRSAVFSSISSRSNYYSGYYDTSSPTYREMVDWTTGGGVARAKIDYYTPGALDIKSVSEENGNYIVTTYEDFTVHYVDRTPDSVNRKTKTYYLRPTGDSFVIYDLAVTEH